MKMYKRIFAFAIAAAMMAGTMLGCGQNGASGNTADTAKPAAEAEAAGNEAAETSEAETAEAPAGDAIELTIWHTWGAGPGLDAMEAAANRYNEINDKNIHVTLGFVASQASGNTQTMDKLMAAIAAGNPPDVALLDNFQVAGWAAQSALMPLDELMEGVGLTLDDVYDWALQGSQYKGTTYSIPYNGDARVLFYNKDMFEAAGLDPEAPPTTIEELTAAAEKLTIRDGANYKQAGFVPWQFAGKPVYCWGWNFGGEFYDAENNVLTVADPKNIEALQWEVDFADQMGGIDFVNFASGLGTGAEDPFVTGQLAMAVRGNFDIANMAVYNPDLNYGVTPIPSKEAGKSANMIGGWGWTIPKGAKNPEASIDFLKYLISEDAQKQMSEMSSSFSPLKSVNEAVFADDEMMAVFLQELEHGKIRPPVPVGQELWDGLNTALDSALHKADTPEKLLTDLNDKMNAELQKFN